MPAMPDAHNVNRIVADLTFTVRQDAKPWFESSRITGGVPPDPFQHRRTAPVAIRDMRADRDRLSLDATGFELRRHETAVDDLYDDGAGADAYDREVEELLKRLTGADIAVVFDRTRRSDAGGGRQQSGRHAHAGGPGACGLYGRFGADARPRRAGAARQWTRVLGSGGRIVQINVWRADPGAGRAVAAGAGRCRQHPEGGPAGHRPGLSRPGGRNLPARLFARAIAGTWAPHMERDEVLLIKGWDSLDDGRARYTPHGAFALPDQDPAAPPRESIELRTFIAFEG